MAPLWRKQNKQIGPYPTNPDSQTAGVPKEVGIEREVLSTTKPPIILSTRMVDTQREAEIPQTAKSVLAHH